jgi:hypothetical protein
VWLVAAGGAVRPQGFVDSTRKHRLADLAPTIRVLLDLPPDVAEASWNPGTPIDELLPRP